MNQETREEALSNTLEEHELEHVAGGLTFALAPTLSAASLTLARFSTLRLIDFSSLIAHKISP